MREKKVGSVVCHVYTEDKFCKNNGTFHETLSNSKASAPLNKILSESLELSLNCASNLYARCCRVKMLREKILLNSVVWCSQSMLAVFENQ